MADYPTTIYNPRTKANKSGVVYDPDETTIIFVEDLDNSDAEIIAIETLLGDDIDGAEDTLTERLEVIEEDLDEKMSIAPRFLAIASHATPTIDTDSYDCFSITALAVAITSMTTNLSGTPANFQKLIIRIKDNGTARAIAWGSSFEAKGVALPTTTTVSKVLTIGLIYDTVTSKWGCVAVSEEE